MARDAREVLGRLMALRALLWRTQFELQLASVAHERHWALTWLADRTTEWDSVNPAT